ncbi:uncharacterized protein LOC142348709 [Convolutriloba macropyga]|uniref:uncharacterized protein LOC142348709 n=1 Tax=Convolutriloba macropyga TaxID=536237 RepID=UPI003F521403
MMTLLFWSSPYFILFCFQLTNFEVLVASAGDDRESLDFIVPFDLDNVGRKCLRYSRYFCCDGYRMSRKQKDREPEQNDKELFEAIVRHSFGSINWFSLRDQDMANGGCCSHQVGMYVEYGQKLGLDPVEYFNKISNYNELRGRDLVYVKVRWYSKACINMISQVGFGRGKLKVVGGRGLTTNFGMPPVGNQTHVPFFKGAELRQRLTFPWFMRNNICGDYPYLCDGWEDEDTPSTSGNRAL